MTEGNRKRRQWKEEDMTAAVSAVNEGRMTKYTATKQFNVPRITLHDRLSGRVKLGTKMGRPTILTMKEEDEIEQTCQIFVEWGLE